MWEILKSWRKESKNDAKTPKKDDAGGSPVHRNFSTSVNFKDLTFSLEQHDDDDEDHGSVDSTLAQAHSEATTAIPSPRHTTKLKRLERNKLIIIMVGLPGRGKTFLCNKLVCYLNWLGHDTKLFNVGSYRRLQKDQGEVQDASFFDKNNVAGLEARRKALEAALDDLKAYLASEAGQVAIFDATNTTNERRQHLIDEFHGKFQYLFIESICTDEQVLEQNYRYKMKYSPDYRGMDEDQALSDFKDRIRKYEEVYEPLNDRSRHYIKLIDMVTGRGHMDINRISGYIPGKIVFFLMQVCKAGMAQERKIWLTRHGESQFNLHGKIGGNAGLSELGQEYARALPDKLLARLPTSHPGAVPVSVWTSTLRRTIETAENIMFPKLRWKALDEIHAGSCDGLTYEEIAERFPEEYEARSRDKLRYRYPAGESYLDVIQRLEPVIIELERERECVCVVAHQAVLRVIYGYFTAAPLAEIPTLEIPLHKLIELKPRPDGTMQVEILPVTEDPGTGAHPSLPPVNHPEHNKRLSIHHARVGSLACDIPSRADSSNGAGPCDSAPSFADSSFIAAMASTSAPSAPCGPLGQGASPPLVFPSLPGPLRVLSPVRCLPFNDPEAMGDVPPPGHGIAGSGPTAPTQAAGVPQPGPYMDGSAGGAGDADGDTEEMEGVCRESTLHVLDPGSDSSAAPTPANSIASAAQSLAATPHASAGGAV